MGTAFAFLFGLAQQFGRNPIGLDASIQPHECLLGDSSTWPAALMHWGRQINRNAKSDSGRSAPTNERPRVAFLDNLRSLVIVLVLSMHACDTYSPFGNWYYRESPPISLATAIVFASYQSFLQAFFMGLLFLISGYFAAASVHRPSFMRDRLLRLGFPALLYATLIGPMTQYFLSGTWGTASFRHEWLNHLTDGEILSETGPMWFALALLIFSLLYALWNASKPQSVPLNRRISVPSNRDIALLIAALSLCTFLVRVEVPEDTSILNFHLGDFPQYILMFALGITAHKSRWLEAIKSTRSNAIALSCLATAAVLWVLLVTLGGALRGETKAYVGGFNVVSLTKCTWESLVCVGMLFLLLVRLRKSFDFSNAMTRFAARNAFAVYLFHPPILIFLALSLRPLVAPALAKAMLLTLVSCGVSFAAAELVLRRIPLLRKLTAAATTRA